jgi:CRP-like cAMP-binding protein
MPQRRHFSSGARRDSDQRQLKAIFDIGSGSLYLRVPPVIFPNEDSHWDATNSEKPMDIANRAPVAHLAKRMIPTLPRPKVPTRIAKRIPEANILLDALPRKECRHLIDGLERVVLTYGEVLYDPGEQIKHVYFPNDCVVSLLTLVDQHQALEVGLVGREGMVGVPLALEIAISPVRALVQGTGTAMRMKAAPFLKVLRQSHALRSELHRYTYSLMTQITQTAACNRFHVVEARLARWLLMTHDRMQASPFHLTQEFLAQMLGVRRVGVTKAARTLQQGKLISYSRGNITILDRKGLEAASCSCYEIVRDVHSAA